MGTEQQTIGVYHRDELFRKGLIRLLGVDYACVEIEKWEDVARSNCETVIIAAPEILCPVVSVDQIKRVIERLNANVLMINYSDQHWWIFRTKYEQLKYPSVEQLQKALNEFSIERRQGLRTKRRTVVARMKHPR